MKISIIGTGNVGSHLAQKLFALDHTIVQIFSRKLSSAEALAKTVEAAGINDLAAIDGTVDLIFIAIPDDHIESVSNKLEKIDALVLHTSGSVPSTVLDKHNRYGVFYPMQTFKKDKPLQWEGIPTFVSARIDEDITLLQSIAEQTKVRANVIDDQQRAALHVAAVFANNYSNHMLVIAERLMQESGLDFDLLKPLIKRTFESNDLPSSAQTGPAQRGDEQTIERQLAFLENNERYQTIYAMIAASIVEEKKQYE